MLLNFNLGRHKPIVSNYVLVIYVCVSHFNAAYFSTLTFALVLT